jgi:hypothetical protein
VQYNWYWSSTTIAGYSDMAYFVSMDGGSVGFTVKIANAFVWPVRGPDRDDDGLDDHEDNCPTVANPEQKDVDSNNIGDVCDVDTIYGTVLGDMQEGVNINFYKVTCGEDVFFNTVITDENGYYSLGD